MDSLEEASEDGKSSGGVLGTGTGEELEEGVEGLEV